jgi:hypothetical protein
MWKRSLLLPALLAIVAAKPNPPECKPGPHGWWGCLESEWVDSHNTLYLPTKLALFRHGKHVRTIQGKPLIWSWAFLQDGAMLAYEAGPLHFSALCTLQNTRTGKVVAEYDCYHDEPEPVLDWVKALP